jgi:hypothetical protein
MCELSTAPRLGAFQIVFVFALFQVWSYLKEILALVFPNYTGSLELTDVI